MKNTNTENLVSKINSNIFFKEFTFSKNEFTSLDAKQKLEFADNVVWLDDLLFIYQIKDREGSSENDQKWFENKILKKGVKQIKSTLNYIVSHPEIKIENEKGHKLDIVKAKSCSDVKKIIIYTPTANFPDELRSKKFYDSKDAGLIHLFHSEDYYWICKYLLTPTEVNQYLNFREDFFLFDESLSNHLPEQYFLGHFLETPNADHFDAKYINNLTNHKADYDDFDISQLIENFSKNIKLINSQTEYYPILKEIAKLNRSELIEFKKRLLLTIENCGSEDLILPYRIYIPRTDCGFVFIPMHSRNSEYWRNALYNFTMAHKYESKARKCVGLILFRDNEQKDFLELFWQFVEADWEFDAGIEKALTDNYPFRKTKTKKVDNPYK